MQTDFNYPDDRDGVSSTTKTGKRPLLLIPRSQRRCFSVEFTLMTILGWIIGGVASIFLESNLPANIPPVFAPQPQIWLILATNLSTSLFAMIFAISQGLVISPYLSFWRWTLTTTFGWLIFLNVAQAWTNYLPSLTILQSLSTEPMVVIGILSTITYNLAAIWLGLLQWLGFRNRVTASWWWILLPSGIFFTISIFMWLVSLLQEFIPEVYRTQILYLSGQGFTALILGVIPAIALCNFKIKPKGMPKISHSSSKGRSKQG